MTARSIQPNKRKSHGQATVEFALVLLVFLAMLYGIIEISRLLLINAEVQNAAREGVYYASRHPNVDASCLRDQIMAPRLTLTNVSRLSVTKTLHDTGDTGMDPISPGLPVQVTVSYTWTSLVNIMPDMGNLSLRPLGPIILQGRSFQFIENPDHDTEPGACGGSSP